MKKTLYSLILFAAFACGTPPPEPATNHDWTEPADPSPGCAEAWSPVERPYASFGSVDVRYPRSLPFAGPVSDSLTLEGWRGERVHAQAVVWTPKDISGLKCTIGPFSGGDGNLPDGIARARFVKYVLSDWFDSDKPCGVRRPDEPSRLMPDLLDEAASMDIPANTSRPLWITVEIPRDAAAGVYTAPVKLRGKGFSKELTLRLDVIDRTLPPPSEWSYYLDLWQHPSSVARVEGVPVWSDAHFAAMEPVMKLLAGAGQKVVTATLNREPWANQCYDPYADMIIWTRFPDGRWEYDFTLFDRWVEFMMGLGVTRAINCYSMLPWDNTLHYRDGATGEFVEVDASPGTPRFREMWSSFLPAFESHLREKGWLGITNIAVDERSPESMAEATSLLAECAPGLGIALADNHKIFKKYPYIKDMCAAIFGPIDPSDIADRRSRGLTTTYYVCCSSEFPNTYTFSDPAEAAYLAWHAAARDYDGFLRWSYNSWTEDPVRDSRFRTWAAGDTYIVYPEGRSSIRFERLVEGIQDFEKMRLLRREWMPRSDTSSRDRSAELDSLVRPFVSNGRDWDWNGTLNAAKRRLNELSR